ncbi:hypothetical protein AaE_014021 [Aphanomyces astaci]|uniref:DDE Tnp4 domain-containing protein n=1 Tax=Aphanomyces astaci TaxID=112090 RepID=A0A6A4Z8T4_APHAT|nr:hypothetical protein AaE_014021 [Aphanomyces astaci]
MLGKPQYEQWFQTNLRCSQSTFCRLASWLSTSQPELMRRETSHLFKKKVAVLLYFLGSEGGYRDTGAAFGMSKSWCVETVNVIVAALAKQAKLWISIPQTPAEWLRIEEDFFPKQNFPGIVGAVDGTLIDIQCTKDYDGFYNRNGDPSLNIQAVVDSKLRFMSEDIRPGSYSDKKIWKRSKLGKSIHGKIPMGCFILGDAGYTLLPWLITPFVPREEGGKLSKLQKHFNFKLSSCRMSVECAFGRLKERFRILKTPMKEKSLDRTVSVVTACFVLHNIFLHYKDDLFDNPCQRRDRNDHVQPQDVDDVENNSLLRLHAVNKRYSIAKIIYQ